MAIRRYVAYPLSYRHVRERMEESVLESDYATVNGWVVRCSPTLESKFRQIKELISKSCRMDETYIKVKGQWVYYYHTVNKKNKTFDFLYINFLSSSMVYEKEKPNNELIAVT